MFYSDTTIKPYEGLSNLWFCFINMWFCYWIQVITLFESFLSAFLVVIKISLNKLWIEFFKFGLLFMADQFQYSNEIYC